MFNAVFVCFDCRTAVRRPADDRDVRCRECGARCHYVGNKLRIAPRHRRKAWTAFRDAYFAARRAWSPLRGWHLRPPPDPPPLRTPPEPRPKLEGGLSRIDAIADALTAERG